MQNKTSNLKKVLFGILLIISIPAYIHSNECSFDLYSYTTVSIDVTTCKADTVNIYNIDLDTIQGNIVYSHVECLLCMSCTCSIGGFVGKDTLYSIINLEKIKTNDSIDFNDTNQVERFTNSHGFIPLFTPFAYKNGDTLAVCWVTNDDSLISNSVRDPIDGIIHCSSRTDNFSKIDFSNINPGELASIYKVKKKIKSNYTDYKWYDLLGRSAKKTKRL